MLALSQGGESQLNPEGKRGTERGAKGRAGGTGLHRINRDRASLLWRGLCGTVG